MKQYIVLSVTELNIFNFFKLNHSSDSFSIISIPDSPQIELCSFSTAPFASF